MNPTPWLFDLDGACERAGDLPSVHSLPRMSPRQKEFAAACLEATIEPTGWFRRLLARAQPDEVETLRRMIREVAGD